MVDDIISLATQFKSSTDLQDYSHKQHRALAKAAERISQLENENAHLRADLALIRSNPIQEIISPEEYVCTKQIEILQQRAIGGIELTLEEVKKLDLLIKNKRLATEAKKTIKAESTSVPTDVSHSELMHLASKPLEEFI